MRKKKAYKLRASLMPHLSSPKSPERGPKSVREQSIHAEDASFTKRNIQTLAAFSCSTMATDCCSCSFTDTSYLGNTCGASFTLFMGLIDIIIRSQCEIAEPCLRTGTNGLGDDVIDIYDFIVVGAGVAGPVVATRLSEDPNNRVLLFEAGPEEPSTTLLPAFATSAVGTELDWQYTTVAQENACLNRGGVCRWPRGKMVSGSQGMQGMMYTRGHASILDNWAAAGNTGWGFEDVLPYFKKSENNQNGGIVDEEYHGFDGPLSVGQFPYHPLLAETVVQAGVESGYFELDVNGKNQTGFAIAQMMVSEGLRGSTARMYLRKAATRENLDVAINSQVVKILTSNNNLAYGVHYLDSNGENRTAFARKEVILSAGAIGSPQLLLLSGIGPKEDLEALSIPVVQDLPVGKNLRNHVSAPVHFTINDTSYESLTLEALDEFLRNRTGPLTSTGVTQTTGFMLSKYATDGVPDLQVFFDGFSADCSRTGLNEECTSGEIGECGKRVLTSRPTVVMPRSVGALKLKSADPLDYPLLDPQYFSATIDADILVDGLKQVIGFVNTEAFKQWNFEVITDMTPGCEAFEFGTDEFWQCHVRRATGAENHQGGTCKMGPAGDPGTVVDPELRVLGIPNLRVVDASVFPYMPNANPTAAIVMAAEKCADMVKVTWNAKDARDTIRRRSGQ